MELKGIVVPVITPVDVDGNLDERAYRQLLNRLIADGVHGLFIGGTAGLGPLLCTREYERMLAVAMEVNAGRIPLQAGVLEASMPRALERLHIVQALGYKAFVLTPTYYIKPRNDRELLAYFGRMRDASGLEMVVYNIPACTGSVVGPDVMLDLCRRGWIWYAKDSSGDAVAFARLCQEGADIGLRMFQGLHPDFACLADQGAAGCVPVPGNLIPNRYRMSHLCRPLRTSGRGRPAPYSGDGGPLRYQRARKRQGAVRRACDPAPAGVADALRALRREHGRSGAVRGRLRRHGDRVIYHAAGCAIQSICDLAERDACSVNLNLQEWLW